ncbi:hypothetical protein MATL_G00022160 [Megalops atlanticus]|uniref:Uncharacterized protein n=1 Tax=Megalops atlanticus TaxID=7932 RepID=A0A9D3QDF0_MEGAT|nr:hypothetical protein MATL_G00022160 [Megalops atlanticus]
MVEPAGHRGSVSEGVIGKSSGSPRRRVSGRKCSNGPAGRRKPGNLPTIMTWVEAQKPGVDGVNIITSDFVDLVDFASTVIKLNNLLLPDRAGEGGQRQRGPQAAQRCLRLPLTLTCFRRCCAVLARAATEPPVGPGVHLQGLRRALLCLSTFLRSPRQTGGGGVAPGPRYRASAPPHAGRSGGPRQADPVRQRGEFSDRSRQQRGIEPTPRAPPPRARRTPVPRETLQLHPAPQQVRLSPDRM